MSSAWRGAISTPGIVQYFLKEVGELVIYRWPAVRFVGVYRGLRKEPVAEWRRQQIAGSREVDWQGARQV